jgi:hypothetical protein
VRQQEECGRRKPPYFDTASKGFLGLLTSVVVFVWVYLIFSVSNSGKALNGVHSRKEQSLGLKFPSSSQAANARSCTSTFNPPCIIKA